jgi:hypothetical protein
MFPFSHTPSVPNTTPVASSPVSIDQFVDVGHAPSLLPNHGAGTGCRACLELLEDAAPAAEHAVSGDDHVDHPAMHGLLHGSASALVPPVVPMPPMATASRSATGPAGPSSTTAWASPPGSPPPSASPPPTTSPPPSASPSPSASPQPGSPTPSSPHSPLTSSAPSPPSTAPAPDPVPQRMLTRSQRGIVQKKQRTDGTVVWFTACHTHGVADPTIEPTTYQDALHIPHWREATGISGSSEE